jgi:hypothetical protein
MALGVRIAAAAVALLWAVLFFGVIDLSVIADPGDEFAPVAVLEASWGVLFTFFVAGALLAVAWQPRATVPAAAQLMIVAVALLVSCLIGLDLGPLPVVVVLAVTSAVVLGLNSVPRTVLLTRVVQWPMLLAAAVAAPFWLWHAGSAFANSRARTQQDDETWGIDHWPVHGAAALAIASAALLASVWPHGRTQLAAATSLAGTVLGAASLAYPSSAGAMPSRAWSFAAVLWSVTLGLLTGRTPKTRRQPSTDGWLANPNLLFGARSSRRLRSRSVLPCLPSSRSCCASRRSPSLLVPWR